MASFPGITVTGATIPVTVAGFGTFSLLASKYLLDQGIGTEGEEGDVAFDPDQWYELDRYLAALGKISSEVSEQVVFQAGTNVPRNAEFPPQIRDFDSALQLLDVAYHMNHKKDGVPMFDPGSGAMLEGIGHYGYKRTQGKNEIVMTCDNPWPCAFDRGIITGLGERFGARVKIGHDRAQCRTQGGKRCVYVVTW